MKAADIATANAIVTRLSQIANTKKAKRDENRMPQFLIVIDNSTQWLTMPKAVADAAYAATIAALDAEASALRRRAAQISLIL